MKEETLKKGIVKELYVILQNLSLEIAENPNWQVDAYHDAVMNLFSTKAVLEGPPAFAFPFDHPYGEGTVSQHGMTLRDYFASKAVTSIMQNGYNTTGFNYSDIAVDAYKLADAMLLERSKKQTS